MSIKILPQELINQIAAGEVVERPNSVVKELVENSLDAGAKNITIEVENGGINNIRIIDDGKGMDREDAEKCLLQHATSKLQTQQDLYNIQTLGFRGEALASISAVSEFTLHTKQTEAVAGYEVKLENNEVKISEVGSAPGTTIEVKNLFYNVPARQKYLKTVITEFNHIVDLFLNYCLSYHQVSWKLVHNNKTIYQFPETTRISRIADCLGEEISSSLLPLEIKLNDILVSGYIGKPQIARNNRKLQYLFINNRPVNEFIVARQIKQAYGTLIPREFHPVYILNLEIDTEKVDVNAHPRKLEVRFSEPQLIYKTIYQAVASVLDENSLNRTVSQQEMKKFVPIQQVLNHKQDRFQTTQFSKSFQKSALDFQKYLIDNDSKNEPLESENENSKSNDQRETLSEVSDDEFIEDYKILGQVKKSYIVVKTEESIKIYDQHATSERIQYEKIKNEWQIGRLASQKMLLAQNIELSISEAEILKQNMSLFFKLGFELSDFGGNSFAVSAVPQVLVNANLKELLLEMVGELTKDIIVEDQISEPIDKIMKMMACKSAIKFGDELTVQGIEALINDLYRLANQYTCVHGRPCFVEFTFDELEKIFKRK